MEDTGVHLLNTALTIAVTILTPVLITALIAVVKQLLARLKVNMSQSNWNLLESLAQQVVLAAEQSGLSGQIEAAGTVKKQWAIDELTRIATEHGLGVDVKTLSTAIEAAVKMWVADNDKKAVGVSQAPTIKE